MASFVPRSSITIKLTQSVNEKPLSWYFKKSFQDLSNWTSEMCISSTEGLDSKSFPTCAALSWVIRLLRKVTVSSKTYVVVMIFPGFCLKPIQNLVAVSCFWSSASSRARINDVSRNTASTKIPHKDIYRGRQRHPSSRCDRGGFPVQKWDLLRSL